MAASDACNVMDRIPNNAAEDINEDRNKYFVKSNTTRKSKSLVRSSSKATFLRYDDDSDSTSSDSKTLICDCLWISDDESHSGSENLKKSRQKNS